MGGKKTLHSAQLDHGSTVPSDALRADVNSHQPASLIRSLRPIDCSMHQNKLQRLQLRCPRSFAVQGPLVWNSLPAELRTPDITLATFRNRLETFLFYVFVTVTQRICSFFPILRYINVVNNNISISKQPIALPPN